MGRQERERTDDFCYRAGIAMGGAGIIVLLCMERMHLSIEDIHIPCALHYLTGFYCPGCGGTRAVKALLQGDILKSILYHPVVFPGVLLYLLFMGTQTVERISRGKIKSGMHFYDAYLWVLLFFIILQCIIKNILVLIFHTDILQRIARL